MRVLFIEPAGAGGISHCTYALAKTLGEQGLTGHILTGTRWIDRPLPDSVHVYPRFHGMRTNPWRLWMQCFRLRTQIDLVHWQCSTYPHLILGFMRMIPLRHVPWVYTVHNVLPHEIKKSSLRLYGQTYRRMQGLLFHTRHSWETFQDYFPDFSIEHEIIPLGEYSFLSNPNPAIDVLPDSPRILFFGNIRHYKGLDLLIRALAEIRQRVPDVSLLIAGQAMGTFEPYENLIRELNLQTHVETRFGYIPDTEIPELMNSSVVAALPYREIDQSAALMLMVAHGKAIVATRVGGIPEVIRDGESGILVPPNDPHSLAAAITDLLTDRTKAMKLGKQAKIDAETRFSWKSIAEQTHRFYERLCKR